MNDTPSPWRRGGPRQRQLFGLGLLLWLILTVLTFRVVSRYMIHVAALYGYDIENVAVQFAVYFGIYAVLAVVAAAGLAVAPTRLTRENQLRLVFLGGATLSLIVALYQSRYGTDKLVNYFTVGTLGTFAAMMLVTQRQYRLVEVIGRPAQSVVDEVLAAHASVPLATTAWDRLKRLVELALSLLIVIVSLPISIALSIVVWLQDPGPLLVAKISVMRTGRSFRQLKLRTMVKDAEQSTGPVPAEPYDKRVTRLGGVLRRTHIDEMPQMLNILLGQMSFVGPRPERTVFVHRHLETIPGYAHRHAVRPGLAGMAQVYGDYYSTPSQKLRYDLLYIRRRSLGLDVRLFVEAVAIALFGVHPARHGMRRRRDTSPQQRHRWRRAYEALRGEGAPDDGAGEDEPREDGTDLP